MSWDVATSGSNVEPVAGTIYNNGSAITFVNLQGDYQKVDPEVNSVMSSGTMHTRLNTRFDDPRYYTGDATS
jgi:hypothetical protein